MEKAAKELKEFFAPVPAKAVLCSPTLAPYFLRLFKLHKVAAIKTELVPNQKLPFIYLAEWNDQRILFMDTLLINEDKYPECLPILSTRALALCGVEQFFVFSEAFAADPSLAPGDVFLLSNYMPLNVISPFIGLHYKTWGDRFLDVTAIFSEENSAIVRTKLDKLLPVKSAAVMWVNTFKSYCDSAELGIAQSLRLPAVVHRGMSQALTLHDMRKTFVFFGLVESSLVVPGVITKEGRAKLAEQLVNVLGAELKPREPLVAH